MHWYSFPTKIDREKFKDVFDTIKNDKDWLDKYNNIKISFKRQW